jgi:hypothetical protein
VANTSKKQRAVERRAMVEKLQREQRHASGGVR